MSILKVANVHFEATGTNRIDYLGDNKVRITSANGTVLSGATTDALMRITQTGTGHALVVEDSTNPDFSPFVVTANGRVIIGANTTYGGFYDGGPHQLQIHLQRAETGYVDSVDDTSYGIQLAAWANGTYGSDLYFTKSRGNTAGEHIVVQQGDTLLWISATGSNGTTFAGESVAIWGFVEPGISGNSVPGALGFFTTAPGNQYGTERMRITSNGKIGIGTADSFYKDEILYLHHPTNLSYIANSYVNVFSSAAYSTNQDRIRHSVRRVDTGNTWIETVHRIGRVVDATPMGYIQFGGGLGAHETANTGIISFGDEVANTELMRIDHKGNVLIGRTNSTVGLGVKLDVNGSINCANLFVNGGAVSGGAVITDQSSVAPLQYLTFTTTTSGTASSLNVATTKLTFNVATGTLSSTVFNSTSDINKKTDLRQINDSMYLIDNLKGYRFNWKENHLPSLGVIAQEVEAVLPELIGDDKSVNYNGLIAVLIEAVKELKAEIEVLKSK